MQNPASVLALLTPIQGSASTPAELQTIGLPPTRPRVLFAHEAIYNLLAKYVGGIAVEVE